MASTQIDILYARKPTCMHIIMCTHTYIAVNPLPCCKISRVVFIGTGRKKRVVSFQGMQDFEVLQDFEKIIWHSMATEINGRFSSFILAVNIPLVIISMV